VKKTKDNANQRLAKAAQYYDSSTEVGLGPGEWPARPASWWHRGSDRTEAATAFALLQPKGPIDVRLTGGHHLDPRQSTPATVAHHPRAG